MAYQGCSSEFLFDQIKIGNTDPELVALVLEKAMDAIAKLESIQDRLADISISLEDCKLMTAKENFDSRLKGIKKVPLHVKEISDDLDTDLGYFQSVVNEAQTNIQAVLESLE